MPKTYDRPIKDLVKLFPKDFKQILQGKFRMEYNNLEQAKEVFNTLEMSEHVIDVNLLRKDNTAVVEGNIQVVFTATELLTLMETKMRPSEVDIAKIHEEQDKMKVKASRNL
jgi:hypothetical protein